MVWPRSSTLALCINSDHRTRRILYIVGIFLPGELTFAA